jgi:hypothetical protein
LDTGSHYVAQAGFELTCSCLHPLTAGITGVDHHACPVLFSITTLSEMQHTFTWLASIQPGSSLETFKNTKHSQPSTKVNTNFLFQEKNPSFQIPPKVWIYMCKNVYLYRNCDGLFSYHINHGILSLCFFVSHQKFNCKIGALFLSSKSMSQDLEICNF